jgi:virginiamycin B lyase
VFESPRDDPYGIAVGADGTAWVTLRLGNQLLHITSDGEMKAFDVPRPAAGPCDIAVGADWSVWFIEMRANRIGRLKDESFEEYSAPGRTRCSAASRLPRTVRYGSQCCAAAA